VTQGIAFEPSIHAEMKEVAKRENRSLSNLIETIWLDVREKYLVIDVSELPGPLDAQRPPVVYVEKVQG